MRAEIRDREIGSWAVTRNGRLRWGLVSLGDAVAGAVTVRQGYPRRSGKATGLSVSPKAVRYSVYM